MIDRRQKKIAEDLKIQIMATLKKYADMWEELAVDSPDVYRI